MPEAVLAASQLGTTEPCVPQVLERLAPDKSGLSALAGAVYVSLSFPELDAVTDAIEFARWAPDGDSVAACAGALLGAFHGFEALPAQLVERLERDLALQVMQNQAGAGWKGEDPDDPPLDPWWDSKYPGV